MSKEVDPSKLTGVPQLDNTPCLWCGKPYSGHSDKENPLTTPRMPCLGLKSGYLPRALANAH